MGEAAVLLQVHSPLGGAKARQRQPGVVPVLSPRCQRQPGASPGGGPGVDGPDTLARAALPTP